MKNINKGDLNYDKILTEEEAFGFKYIRITYNKLLEYENKRDKYIDIDSFYPIIAKAIIDESEKGGNF